MYKEFSQHFRALPLQCGAKILFASDDFFAAAEGMLQDTEPIFIADKFTGWYKYFYLKKRE